MVEFKNAAEAQRLAKLVHEQEQQKLGAEGKDRWGMPKVPRGFLRGRAMNPRTWDETCEFGVLHNLQFDLVDDPEQAGIPVLMQGTDFNDRLMEGSVVDVPKPRTDARPIHTNFLYFSHTVRDGKGKIHTLKAYYPGRDDAPRRVNIALASLMVLVPTAFLLVAVYLLRHVFHIIN
jgi:hypothetical protein